jgi:sugar diacid utilization regulator
LVGRIAEGALALLRNEPKHRQLAEMTRKLSASGCRIGIGRQGVGAAELRQSAREALRAVDIGELLRLEEGVHRYSELALFDLIEIGTPRALEFARRALGALALPGPGDMFRKTLRALCQNGFRLKGAAATLGVHPHTLSYRVNRLQERFGIDLEDGVTRLRVHLALLALDASRTSPVT